jgi:ribosome biogenesis SPOUT family RNA methylase Rps3
MKSPVYIIEHLEPELFEWCLIEYEHISELVGKNNLWFTNIKTEKDRKKLEKLGKVFSESIRDIKLDWKKACILDPEAKKTLEPDDNFSYYIFGGILGDYPPKKRTKKELTKFISDAEQRNIGKKQMSTDNAVFTVKQIAENRKKFSELKFTDKVSIEINEVESVELPYRYNIEDGKPFMSPKIKEYLRKKKGF